MGKLNGRSVCGAELFFQREIEILTERVQDEELNEALANDHMTRMYNDFFSATSKLYLYLPSSCRTDAAAAAATGKFKLEHFAAARAQVEESIREKWGQYVERVGTPPMVVGWPLFIVVCGDDTGLISSSLALIKRTRKGRIATTFSKTR